MKLELTIPGKTYLLGEYLTLVGGPALLLNTLPRFKLTATENAKNYSSDIDHCLKKGSPAEKYLKKYQDFFKNFSLEFNDPYQGQGGLGASSAEFCLLAGLKNYYSKNKMSDWDLLVEYLSLVDDGKHAYPPSGADIISQWNGAITYFNKSNRVIKKLVWSFSELSFFLVHTKNKIATHLHLQELENLDVNGFEPIVNSALQAIQSNDSAHFCQAINDYAEKLSEKNLVNAQTIKLLTLIRQHPAVLAAKGCGALSADVIFIMVAKKQKQDFQAFADASNLTMLAVDAYAREGLTINLIKGKEKIVQVITVNEQDHQLGVVEKLVAHQNAILHRAFSIFIFRKKNEQIELLLQQRALEKYHCGGLWSNACCSHPVPGEDILSNAQQRLHEEMGIRVPLQEVGAFRYIAPLDNGLIEHEYDHVFVGSYENDHCHFDKNEIAACRWIELNALQRDIKEDQKKYTPWLEEALQLCLRKNAFKV